jgi:hypothetical protein
MSRAASKTAAMGEGSSTGFMPHGLSPSSAHLSKDSFWLQTAQLRCAANTALG